MSPTKHCCELMDLLLDENKVAIHYAPHVREYNIELRHKIAVQGITYCPKDLRDEHFDTLEKEYGIQRIEDAIKSKDFPQELRTDEWWKKRGLLPSVTLEPKPFF